MLNTVDRNSVLSLLLEDIKKEFGASDAQLGLLGGIPFAFFYAFLGIPLAVWADRSSRRNVLAFAVAMWSAMTAVCGLALSFVMLFFSRVGVAVGEAGGSPPSHSLISDYFPKSLRGTAFSIFALGVPFGTARRQLRRGLEQRHLRVAGDILHRRSAGRVAGAHHEDDDQGAAARLRGPFPEPAG